VKSFLPDEYKESHEYCFFLHDRIADVVVIGEKYRLFDQQISFKSVPDQEEFVSKQQGEELLSWLKERNYAAELNLIYLKQVYVALVSDFCHFIYEALSTCKKGKNTVAFALLRKPLKDNLFMLENLLVNKEHFHELFTDYRGFIDLANDRVNEENKKELISSVLQLLNLNSVFSEDFLYDVRYNKQCTDGFEPLWQQASHLITTCRHYSTETGNINFVFSNTENRYAQWDHIYSLLPQILFYAYKIVMKIALDEIYLEFVPRRGGDFRALLGFLKLFGLEALAKTNIECKCNKCGTSLDPVNIPMTIITRGKVRCQKCRKALYK
jgi:hypothetical protein